MEICPYHRNMKTRQRPKEKNLLSVISKLFEKILIFFWLTILSIELNNVGQGEFIKMGYKNTI